MRILADVRCLQDPLYSGRGVGSHAAFLLQTIRSRAGGAAELVGLVDDRLPPLAGRHAGLLTAARSVFVPDDSVTPTLFLQLSPMTHDTVPPARLLDRGNVLPIAVVYDFIPRDHPEHHLADRRSRLAYAAAFKWLPAHRGFLAISEHTAAELREVPGVDPRSIVVTGVAIRDAFQTVGTEPPPRDGPPRNVLFVGGADPRKNLETVIAAFGRLAAARKEVPHLVVAGGCSAGARRRALSRLPARVRPAVSFLDVVDDAHLASVYAGSVVTVVASVAEGFSLPVVEAIASGCPAIVSDIPAHRELVTDRAARFQPLAVDELADRIGELLDSPAARRTLAAAQRPVAGGFTAAAVADRVWGPICDWHGQFVRRPKPPRCTAAVAFVTPFPPDRSGVADYSLACVAALGRRVEVDVYTDQPSPTACPGVRAFHPISAAAWLRPDYAATVAVIGNSPHHARIVDLHERLGGACIVHDNRLLELYRRHRGPAAVRRMASRALGRAVSRTEIEAWLAEPDTLPTLFLDAVLARAHPPIVHSVMLARHLGQRFGTTIETLPFCVHRDLPPELLDDESRRRARGRLGIADDTTLVVSLGMVTQAKKPRAVVDAVNLLRRRGRSVHLRFVGDAGVRAPELRKLCEDPLAISFTGGWASEEEYRTSLLAADCAIQLRTHRFGGLSGAVCDCIAAGLPTVANEDLAAACDAPSYVLRVSDALDPREIAAAVAASIDRGLPAGHLDRERRAYIESHSFDRYAERLLEVLGVTGPRRPFIRRRSA